MDLPERLLAPDRGMGQRGLCDLCLNQMGKILQAGLKMA
jgi:hypothetical protein